MGNEKPTKVPPREPRSCPPVDRQREEAALQHLERGDRRAALSVLIETYGTRITTFASRVLRDRERAKDVRQLVFIDAYQKLDTFQRRASLWSWLCGIAYHRCLDELKRTRQTLVENSDVLEELLGPSEIPMDQRVAQQRALEHCLGRLPETMRTQIVMRCFLGLSYEEISELVGDPPGTIQVRISRILPRLRRCLRNEGVP